MADYTERKAKLVQENEWLPKAIEMLNLRLIDKGFNVFMEWMGYYDEYVIAYNPKRYYSHEDDCYKTREWSELEIFSKTEVFNPYKYCGGKGYEYEKLTEMEIHKDMWKPIRRYISMSDYQINGKKVDIHSDPYYERTEFINGSDVPVSGYYE